MSDRIITAVRVSPVGDNEIKNNSFITVDIDGHFVDGRVIVVDPAFYQKGGGSSKDRRQFERSFEFDYFFSCGLPGSSIANQEEVFVKCGAPLLKHCMDGLNCSIIAYGQTGSGKVDNDFFIFYNIIFLYS